MSGVLDFLSPRSPATTAASTGRPLRARARSSATPARRSRSATAGSCRSRSRAKPSASRPSGIADLSHLGKLERAARRRPPIGGGGIVWYRISPRRALVALPAGERAARATGCAGDALVARRDRARTRCSRIAGPEARDAPAPPDASPPLPVAAARSPTSPRTCCERGGGYWIVVAQELGHYLWEVAVDRAEALGGGPRRRRRAPRRSAP